MKINNLDKLHDALQKDDYGLKAQKIMQDLYMRWFAFGLGLGITITCILFITLGWYNRLLN